MDNITKEKAQVIVKRAFCDRLIKNMYRKSAHANGNQSLPLRFRRAGVLFPGAKRAYRAMMSRLPGEKNAMQLESLLKPGSPHHEQFMPAYGTMVEPL